MTTFKFGDVVIVNYTFTDQSGSKPRPAVVVSRDEYNEAMPDVVLMPVTSQLRERTSFPDTWLEAWQDCGLRKPSAVKPAFVTVEKTLLSQPIGQLAEFDRAALQTVIGSILQV